MLTCSICPWSVTVAEKCISTPSPRTVGACSHFFPLKITLSIFSIFSPILQLLCGLSIKCKTNGVCLNSNDAGYHCPHISNLYQMFAEGIIVSSACTWLNLKRRLFTKYLHWLYAERIDDAHSASPIIEILRKYVLSHLLIVDSGSLGFNAVHSMRKNAPWPISETSRVKPTVLAEPACDISLVSWASRLA